MLTTLADMAWCVSRRLVFFYDGSFMKFVIVFLKTKIMMAMVMMMMAMMIMRATGVSKGV